LRPRELNLTKQPNAAIIQFFGLDQIKADNLFGPSSASLMLLYGLQLLPDPLSRGREFSDTNSECGMPNQIVQF
jgi:hypothetical protein